MINPSSEVGKAGICAVKSDWPKGPTAIRKVSERNVSAPILACIENGMIPGSSIGMETFLRSPSIVMGVALYVPPTGAYRWT